MPQQATIYVSEMAACIENKHLSSDNPRYPSRGGGDEGWGGLIPSTNAICKSCYDPNFSHQSFNCSPGLTVRTVNDGLWTVQNLPRQFRHQSTPLTCIAAVYGIA
ncbi:hypothetical protein LSTR_LSTR007549 [Laodelphax striatellus]|uniref:Uncharacterized protein n=1 Tax=Laodelphax striatellus TaxID=195883 RepID=A0A482XQY7_LAOST|nr:hypothetical protein LSTR_LSTR007549 [Laodelphax striatellus]